MKCERINDAIETTHGIYIELILRFFKQHALCALLPALYCVHYSDHNDPSMLQITCQIATIKSVHRQIHETKKKNQNHNAENLNVKYSHG